MISLWLSANSLAVGNQTSSVFCIWTYGVIVFIATYLGLFLTFQKTFISIGPEVVLQLLPKLCEDTLKNKLRNGHSEFMIADMQTMCQLM